MVTRIEIEPDSGLVGMQTNMENIIKKLRDTILSYLGNAYEGKEDVSTDIPGKFFSIHDKNNNNSGFGFNWSSQYSTVISVWRISSDGKVEKRGSITPTTNPFKVILNLAVSMEHGFFMTIKSPISADTAPFGHIKFENETYWTDNTNMISFTIEQQYIRSIGLPSATANSALLCKEYYNYKPLDSIYSYSANPEIGSARVGSIQTFGGIDYMILPKGICWKN